jgi:hypothetical protein
MYNYADARLKGKIMKSLLLVALLLFVLPDLSNAGKEKKTYVAKTKKSVKYKKKRNRVYIRKYPVRSNIIVSGDELKLQDMINDFYE